MVNIKNEKAVINDAIQYWKGFVDSLEWTASHFKDKKDQELLDKLQDAHFKLNEYKSRLRNLNKR